MDGKIAGIWIPKEEAAAWAQIYKEVGCPHNEIVANLIRLCDHFALSQLAPFVEEEMAVARANIRRVGNREMTRDEEERMQLIILERLRRISVPDLERGIRFTPEDVAKRRII